MALTLDRATAVLVDDQVGRTRYLTPEGFLLCEGVRIARVGPMLYAQSEVPDIEPAGRGMVTVERSADVLFDPEAIASFNGKPVTNGHPPEFVLPISWKLYSVGTVLNPRQGEGVEADYLMADLLITDQAAIDDVQSGKREVSCGYDAAREQIKPGLGRQIKIVGNHVALVTRGRGGPSCAIQDEEPTMAKRSAWDRLRTAFKAQDEVAFEEEMKEAQKDEDGGSDEPQRLVIEVKQPEAAAEPKVKDEADPVDPLAEIKAVLGGIVERLDKLEAGKSDETADEDPDEEDKKDDPAPTMDAAALREAFADVRAKAEILSPGIQLPTFDAKAVDKGVSALHDLRIRSLKSAYADDKRKVHVVSVMGGGSPNFSAMTADAAAVVFNAAAGLAKAANSDSRTSPGRTFPQGPMTTAKYQDLIKQRHARG